MEARDQDSHNRKAVITAIVVIACAALGLGVHQYHTWMHSSRSTRAHDREFHLNRHSDFLRQVQRKDKIDDLVLYEREKAEKTRRYEELKGKPQVVWGTVVAPAGKDLGVPLRMRLKPRPSEKAIRTGIDRTVVDDQLHFAFSVAEPRE
jgi:hypothetical protein